MGNMLIAALLLAGTAGETQVDVGKVNLATLPRLEAVKRPFPTPGMVTKVESILESGACKIPDQSYRTFDITVPYAVLVEPDGSARRVVVGEMNCAPLETFVGTLVLSLAEQGDFQASRGAKARWYGSEINFNLQ